jgi:hypothetical protein
MAMFRKTELPISVGDRFVEVSREKTEWRVEFVFNDPNAVPHARMRRSDDATVQRTFAVAVLMSDPRFRRTARAPAPDQASAE